MPFSKFFLKMVRDLSHSHKIPLKLKRLLYQKKNAQRLLVKSEALLQSFLRGTSTAKAIQFVAVPRGGICWHQKCHFASSTSKAIWSRILLQTGKATSSIRSWQNQTKTTRSFKVAKRRVHMKSRAISTPSGLTSISNSWAGAPDGDNVKYIKSSIRVYGWSQNTSKRLHVEFQVKPTPFDPPSTLERQNQASQQREPPMPPLIKQSTWVASACFQRAARQISGHSDNVWPGFDAPKRNQAYPRRSSPGPWPPNRS